MYQTVITTTERFDEDDLRVLGDFLENHKEIRDKFLSINYSKQVEDNNLFERLERGRNYLMSLQEVNPLTIIEDTLEAFGFGRNGLK